MSDFYEDRVYDTKLYVKSLNQNLKQCRSIGQKVDVLIRKIQFHFRQQTSANGESGGCDGHRTREDRAKKFRIFFQKQVRRRVPPR